MGVRSEAVVIWRVRSMSERDRRLAVQVTMLTPGEYRDTYGPIE